jgi:hypothetical protein
VTHAICLVLGFVPGVLLGICHGIDLERRWWRR